MKGAFNLRPPKTQYHAIWDVSTLLNYLQKMSTDSDMNKSKKTICLLMLLSGTRLNTLTHLKITNMYLTVTEYTFIFAKVSKHSRHKYCQKLLICRTCPECSEFYPVKNLLNYLDIRLKRSSDLAQNHLSKCQGIQLPDKLRIQ